MLNFLFFIKCLKSKCGKTGLLTCCEQCYLDAMLFQIQCLFFSLESFQIQRTADCLLASFPVIGTTKRNEKPIMNSNYSLEENQVAQSITHLHLHLYEISSVSTVNMIYNGHPVFYYQQGKCSFLHQLAQTGSVAYPASYSTDTRGFLPGECGQCGVKLCSPLSRAKVTECMEIYIHCTNSTILAP